MVIDMTVAGVYIFTFSFDKKSELARNVQLVFVGDYKHACKLCMKDLSFSQQ
jgi:hypothetical protein